MSVFTMIKKGRQAAKEHAARQAEKQKAEAAKAPYKHVPRHAASDAISTGPSVYKESDRPKIAEQNRRRSMMTASGLGMSGTSTPVHVGFPRANSALSQISYPAAYASPVVHMPRAYSYTGAQPGWSNHGGEVVYTPMESRGVKGKEVERVMVDSGRASRTSSKASFGPYPVGRSAASGPSRTSPAGSSSTSTSSQDDLEMKSVKHSSAASEARSSGPVPGSCSLSHSRPAGEVDYFHRLHLSNPRRLSDPSSAKQYMSQPKSSYVPQKQGGPRVTSLPPTPSGIPPVPALPVVNFSGPLAEMSSPASSSSIAASFATAASSVTVGPNPTSRGSPPRLPLPEDIAGPLPATEFDINLPEIGTATTAQPEPRSDSRTVSKSARFTELGRTVPSISEANRGTVSPVSTKPMVRTTVTTTYALPTEFDESSLATPQQLTIPAQLRKAKLTKNYSSKLAKNDTPKKNRWSLRSSKVMPIAV